MTAHDIQSFRDAEPFHPFEVVLDDGRIVRVSRKDAVSFSPSKKLLAVDSGGAFSHYEIAHIAELRPMRFPDRTKITGGS